MKSVPYESTEVSVEKSRMRVERLLERFGCEATMVFKHQNGTARIAFQLAGTPFVLEVAPEDWERMYLRHHPGTYLTEEKLHEKAVRACWRHLESKLKIRLEEIEMGTDPREVFAADIMVADGRRLGKRLIEEIEAGGKLGTVPLLLGPPSE